MISLVKFRLIDRYKNKLIYIHMQVVFLIITYGNKYLNKCISSIRKFYNDIPIYIVDNMVQNNISLENIYNNV